MMTKDELRRLDKLIAAQKKDALIGDELNELAALAGAILAEHADLATAARLSDATRERQEGAEARFVGLLGRLNRAEAALRAVLEEVAPNGVTGGKAVRAARELLRG